MWPPEVRNGSWSVAVGGNRSTSKMVDPDLLTGQVSHTLQQPNASATAAARPSGKDGSGIIHGAIAATLFIALLLVLYTILWKCMVSQPQRKQRRIRPRLRPKSSV
ncbi:uncharacterized protein LOC142893034 [Nelusetta ayraudi]|uniref:uncharacterized protein LOC142893034 n=1 Tax=Nelusetta ayraudi TaxID=303726 RepID=UPI003F71583B